MRKLISALFCLISVSGFSQGIEFDHDLTFQQALDKARSEGRLIFMDCYTTWCGPCKRLASQVFPDSAVGAYFNRNFVNMKVDMEKGEGIDIATRYQIRAYPTMLWLDENGAVKHKQVGGLDPAGLIAAAQKAGDPLPDMVSGMDKKYASGNRELPFLEDYLAARKASGLDVSKLFSEYLSLLNENEWKRDGVKKTVYNLTNDVSSPGLPIMMKNKAAISGLMTEKGFNDKVNFIANNTLTEAIRKNSEDKLMQAVSLVKMNKSSDAAQQVAKMQMDYYLNTSNAGKYDKYVSAYLKKYAAKDEKMLSDMAWKYYVNTNDTKYLQKASNWAHTAVNIKDTYNNNTTYAYLQYKLGNFSEATKACDYALLKAKDENISPTSAQSLKEAIIKELETKK
ncbi:MAG: thioredoxin domain-containing protein [Chitinophagales bacterium]